MNFSCFYRVALKKINEHHRFPQSYMKPASFGRTSNHDIAKLCASQIDYIMHLLLFRNLYRQGRSNWTVWNHKLTALRRMSNYQISAVVFFFSWWWLVQKYIVMFSKIKLKRKDYFPLIYYLRAQKSLLSPSFSALSLLVKFFEIDKSGYFSNTL